MAALEQALLTDSPDHQIPDLKMVEEQEISNAPATEMDVHLHADPEAENQCTRQSDEKEPAETATHLPNDPAGASHKTDQGLRSSMGSPGRQLHSPQVSHQFTFHSCFEDSCSIQFCHVSGLCQVTSA